MRAFAGGGLGLCWPIVCSPGLAPFIKSSLLCPPPPPSRRVELYPKTVVWNRRQPFPRPLFENHARARGTLCTYNNTRARHRRGSIQIPSRRRPPPVASARRDVACNDGGVRGRRRTRGNGFSTEYAAVSPLSPSTTVTVIRRHLLLCLNNDVNAVRLLLIKKMTATGRMTHNNDPTGFWRIRRGSKLATTKRL